MENERILMWRDVTCAGNLVIGAALIARSVTVKVDLFDAVKGAEGRLISAIRYQHEE